MPYIFTGICLLITGLLIWIASKAWDYDFPGTSVMAVVLAVVMGVTSACSALNALDYAVYSLAPEVRVEQHIEERNVYVSALSEMSSSIERDVTGSAEYLEIYEKIMDFNNAVRRANKWADTWADGILGDPSYIGFEIIPLD